MSTSSANPGRSAERWRRLALHRSGDVEPDLRTPRARSRGGEPLTADITAGSATKYRRALDDFGVFLQSETLARVVLSLRMDSSSLLRLPQDTWNEALALANFPLALQGLGSLPCVDLFCLQLLSARRSLTPLFISALCGDCKKPGSLQSRQSSEPL